MKISSFPAAPLRQLVRMCLFYLSYLDNGPPTLNFKQNIVMQNGFHFLFGHRVHQQLLEQREHPHRMQVNGLCAIYDDDYIFFDCENQIYESYNYSNKKNDKKLNVNCRNSACSHSNDTCEAYVELGEYFVFNSKIYKCYNKSKVVSGENRLYGSIVEAESGKTVFKNSIPTDMSSELAIDDSEAILYVRVLSDDIVKVDGDRHAYLLDKNFNIIYCHYNIGKFPWGAILNGNYYYINDINEIVKVNLTTFESKSIASNGKAFMADNDENFIYYSNEFSELYKLSPDDESSIKIADNALFFSVQNKYIYASGGDNVEEAVSRIDGCSCLAVT